VSVDAFIGFENVAVGLTVTGTPTSLSAGDVERTVGGAASVVKLHRTGEISGTWSAVSTAVDKAAVYVVVPSSCAVGVRVAVCVVASYETVAGTGGAPDAVSVNVWPVTLAAFSGTLKVAETAVVRRIPMLRCAGLTAVVSGAAGVPSLMTATSTK
jgi:hypothetical protein